MEYHPALESLDRLSRMLQDVNQAAEILREIGRVEDYRKELDVKLAVLNQQIAEARKAFNEQQAANDRQAADARLSMQNIYADAQKAKADAKAEAEKIVADAKEAARKALEKGEKAASDRVAAAERTAKEISEATNAASDELTNLRVQIVDANAELTAVNERIAAARQAAAAILGG